MTVRQTELVETSRCTARGLFQNLQKHSADGLGPINTNADNRELKQRPQRRQRERQRANRQNNNFARASRFFVHFFAERELLPFAVVQKVDSAIRWINRYPVDNAIGFPNIYPLDGDLSGG